MIVVSDTSILSYLLQIGKEHLLTTLFQNVVIPPAVCSEMNASPNFTDFERMLQTGEVSVIHIKNIPFLKQLKKSLDEGEAEAIALAKELVADLLLIDEHLGDTIAKQYGLKTTGLLGVLIDAKKFGHLTDMKNLLIRLQTETSFHMSQTLFQTALRLANES